MLIKRYPALLVSIVFFSLRTKLNALTADIIELEPLVQSVTRFERPLHDVPASVTVLGSEEIRQSPALTIDGLLRSVPSLNLLLSNSDIGHPTSQTISIRGLGGKRVLVLLDGIPLNDPFGGWINWSKVPKNQIEKIEIVRGGGSSVFGNYAMGGVINIVTKRLDQTSLLIEGSGGTQSTTRDSLGGMVGTSKGGVSFFGEIFDTDGYKVIHPDEDSVIFTKARSDHANFGAKAERIFTNNSTLSLTARHSKANQSAGTAIDTNSRDTFDWAVDSKTNSSLGTFRANLFGERQNFETNNSGFSGPTSIYLSDKHDIPSSSMGGSLQWNKSISSKVRSVGGGLDVRSIKGEDDEERFDAAGQSTAIRRIEGRQDAVGLFVESSVFPLPSWEVLGSVRYDRWDNTDGFLRDSTTGTTYFPHRHATAVSPRLLSRLGLGGHWALRGGVYKGFRVPTLNELYRETISIFTTFQNNSTLDPERMRGAETGIDFSQGPLEVKVTGFWNEVTNTITFVQVNPFLVEQANIGETRSRGVESSVAYQPTPHVTFSASYVFTDITIQSYTPNPIVEGNRLPGVPKSTVLVGGYFHHPRIGSARLNLRYLSNQFQDTENTLPFGSHTVLDLFLSKKVADAWEIFLQGENIFDRTFIASRFGGARIVGAPQQVLLGVRWNWKKRGSE